MHAATGNLPCRGRSNPPSRRFRLYPWIPSHLQTPVPSGDAHARLHEAFTRLRDDLSQTIVGQAALVERR